MGHTDFILRLFSGVEFAVCFFPAGSRSLYLLPCVFVMTIWIYEFILLDFPLWKFFEAYTEVIFLHRGFVFISVHFLKHELSLTIGKEIIHLRLFFFGIGRVHLEPKFV